MKGGARDTAIALSARLGVLALSVGIQSTLAWMLGPGGRGSYAVCLLFATLLSTAFTLGMDRAGQYFAASGRMDVSESVRATIASMIIGSLAAIAVGRLLMLSDLSFFAKADRSSFYVALAIIPVAALQNSLVMLLVGMRRIGWMAVVSLTSVAVQLAAALVLVLGLRLGVNGALLSVIVAGAAAIAVALRLLARAGWASRGPVSWAAIKALAAYGVRYYVAKLSNLVHFRVGTLILAFFAGAPEIGLFAAASQLVSKVTLISKAVETALYARVASDEGGRPLLVAQTVRVTVLAAGLLLVLITALSRPIVTVVLSPRFLSSLPLIWIIAPGILVRSASNVLMAYFMGTNRPAVCSWSIGLGVLVNVVGIVALLPPLGLSGAAWAMTAGYAMSGLVLVASFRRVTGTRLADLWKPRRGDLVAVAEAIRGVRGALGRQPTVGPGDRKGADV
jgi:O-antigen/teichoic acid export membrane protein